MAALVVDDADVAMGGQDLIIMVRIYDICGNKKREASFTGDLPPTKQINSYDAN